MDELYKDLLKDGKHERHLLVTDPEHLLIKA